jgi:hypothetical protein
MNGVKTAVRVRTNDGYTHRLFLKRTTGSYNGESDIYESLQGLGGPFPTYYGHVDHPTGERTLLVEYLPHCHIWPIPMDFHLAWARCAVRLSHIPVDESLPIPRLDWPSRSDEFITGVEDALSMEDKTLGHAFREHSLTKLPEQLIGRLPGILQQASQLPTAFTHTQFYSDHVGQRRTGEEVLCYDLAEAVVAPRFMDFNCVIIDHAEPYETSVEIVTRSFHSEYCRITGTSLSWADFLSELQFNRLLLALSKLPTEIRFVTDQLRNPEHQRSTLWDGPRKWILLHLQAIQEYLKKGQAIRSLWVGNSSMLG